ncbi:hypothetical protein [Nocardia brasiliensis]|uniref:hypothetical protein n=1 Tax=Nocardia brasiliensis TaxID=37326 RepID=UPI001894A537|nr:hypothetical protein [Nocardia brasiliensis]MBF6547020.1 hypothetical protein [Nocardia brasiliensis]
MCIGFGKNTTPGPDPRAADSPPAPNEAPAPTGGTAHTQHCPVTIDYSGTLLVTAGDHRPECADLGHDLLARWGTDNAGTGDYNKRFGASEPGTAGSAVSSVPGTAGPAQRADRAARSRS